MAELLEDLPGESLLAALRGLWRAFCATSDEVVDWFREVAIPPPGLSLVSEDGCTFTGVVLVERSVVIAILAVRHPARSARRSSSRSHPLDGFGESAPPWSSGPLAY
ncbi:MAG: hypothetical protein KC766_36270 [Myxococcales bacterium]|nr:hypothetical protein [Myxococcales bacterium]